MTFRFYPGSGEQLSKRSELKYSFKSLGQRAEHEQFLFEEILLFRHSARCEKKVEDASVIIIKHVFNICLDSTSQQPGFMAEIWHFFCQIIIDTRRFGCFSTK